MAPKVSGETRNTGNLKIEEKGFQVKHVEAAVRVRNKNIHAVIKAGVFVTAGNLASPQKTS